MLYLPCAAGRPTAEPRPPPGVAIRAPGGGAGRPAGWRGGGGPAGGAAGRAAGGRRRGGGRAGAAGGGGVGGAAGGGGAAACSPSQGIHRQMLPALTQKPLSFPADLHEFFSFFFWRKSVLFSLFSPECRLSGVVFPHARRTHNTRCVCGRAHLRDTQNLPCSPAAWRVEFF